VTSEHGTDRSRRACDAVDLHFVAEGTNAIGRWIAIRLSDGGTDGTLYDTRADAIKHQFHELWCAYHCILPTGANPADMETFLAWTEGLYSQGMRPAQNRDPSPLITMPSRREDLIIP
jgi:hypothetical protein